MNTDQKIFTVADMSSSSGKYSKNMSKCSKVKFESYHELSKLSIQSNNQKRMLYFSSIEYIRNLFLWWGGLVQSLLE